MGKGKKKKKNKEMELRLQLFMAENKISVSEEDFEEITKKLNEMLVGYPYPEKAEQVLSLEEIENTKKDKD